MIIDGEWNLAVAISGWSLRVDECPHILKISWSYPEQWISYLLSQVWFLLLYDATKAPAWLPFI